MLSKSPSTLSLVVTLVLAASQVTMASSTNSERSSQFAHYTRCLSDNSGSPASEDAFVTKVSLAKQ